MGRYTVNFKYGTVYIEDIVYHRGEIPLPKGTIDLRIDIWSKVINRHGLGELYLVDELLPTEVRFASAYTEFLYPGSPGYGFSLDIDYPHIDEYDVIWLLEQNGIISKDPRRKIPNEDEIIDDYYERFQKACDELCDYFYEAKEAIYKFIEKLQSEIDDDLDDY